VEERRSATDRFPQQYARTRRFTLGRPRSFSVAPDGTRVAFLRSPAGDDPNTSLWVLDVQSGQERMVMDALSVREREALSREERARRERARETAGGIVQFGADRDVRTAVVPIAGRLFAVDLTGGGVRELPARGPVFDPRPDPGGEKVAYVSRGALHVLPLDADVTEEADRIIAGEDDPDVRWGVAEFIASEEMDRPGGFWWAPDGAAVAAARVDDRPVRRWYIDDPADPASPPVEIRYPAAGADNAAVTLHVLRLDGDRVDVRWDNEAFPYLVNVTWPRSGPLTALVQSRDQRRWVVLAVDQPTGEVTPLWEDHDDAWLEIVPGIPAWTDRGALVMTADRDGARRLLIDGRPVTPPDLQVRQVVTAGKDVLITGSHVRDPEETHVWRVAPRRKPVRLTQEPGVHGATGAGNAVVIVTATLESDGVDVSVWNEGERVASIPSHAETPVIRPQPRLIRAGRREIRTAVLLPEGHDDRSLPVLLDPYGGPQFQRVTQARGAFLQSQWFAEQGFAVVVADGRGTPGRGVAWEKAVHLDLATPVLEDQVEALHEAAERFPVLDLSRVAIRGWSFGGFLAALAVLRRPDVFHAAIAGAPVTDQRLYDTHYTERFLGHPAEQPEAYRRSSLIEDAPRLERPLLLIHGLADDNVVVANTLRLSKALLKAGRPHRTLLLPGVTHMTPQMEEHLLWVQLAFLRESLGLTE
jgi:dipeptidyl-peptidase 4